MKHSRFVWSFVSSNSIIFLRSSKMLVIKECGTDFFRAYKACLTVAAYYNMFNFRQREEGGIESVFRCMKVLLVEDW